jgi:hypothetical protein
MINQVTANPSFCILDGVKTEKAGFRLTTDELSDRWRGMKFSGMVRRQQAELYRPGNRLAAGISLQFAINIGGIIIGTIVVTGYLFLATLAT